MQVRQGRGHEKHEDQGDSKEEQDNYDKWIIM